MSSGEIQGLDGKLHEPLTWRWAMSRGAGVLKEAGPVLEVVRIFDASRHDVWKAWTDPEALKKWWGPRGAAVPEYTLDLRPGGPWRARMRAPSGEEHWARGIYQEIVPPRRLTYTWIWEHGDNHEMLVNVSFEELGYKTRVTLVQSDFETPADCDEHREGWTQSMDRLVEYVGKR
jgi:uncharacterized protein YndB with AHSA1/START domain